MLFIASLTILFIIQESILVGSEMRFVCPRPQNPSSTASQRHCGADGFKNDFDTDFIEVHPGPFTVHVEETVFRKDSPARISLVEWRPNGQSCVLLHHIPHNNAVTKYPNRTECKTDDYPLGRCGSSSYITVNIPDVQCERCFLQLMTLQTLTNVNSPCVFTSQNPGSNCTASYSCANIRIRPSEARIGVGLDACKDYISNLGGRWPFAERLIFQASLGGSPFSDGYAKFEMDHTNFLRYNISLGNIIPVPGQDKIFIALNNSGSYAGLQAIPVTSKTVVGELGAFDDLLKAFLMSQELVLEIRLFGRQSLYRSITGGTRKYIETSYHPHGIAYTPSGWLKGADFVGPEAPHPQVVYPHGACAPVPPQFAAKLEDETGTLRALVTYGIIPGEQLFLDAVVISPKGSARQISFNQTGFPESLMGEFAGEFITRNYAHGNIALLEQGLPDTVSAVVKVNTSYITVSAQPFKAVKALLRDEADLHTALGTIRLLETGDLEVTVAIINKTVDRTVEAEVWIKGPQTKDNSTELFAVPVPRTDMEDIGGWVGQTVITVKDSYIPQCLRIGAISLEITFPQQTPLSAPFDPVNDWFCEGSDSVVCLRATFSEQGGPVDKGLPVLAPNGFATFYMITDYKLQYSITVQDMRKFENVILVELQTSEERVKRILGHEFTQSQHLSKAVACEGSVDLSEKAVNELALGRMSIVVLTSQSNQGKIRGTIPKMGETKSISAANVKSSGPIVKMPSLLGFILLLCAFPYSIANLGN